MKKNVTIAFAVASMFVSCSQQIDIDKIADEQPPLAFPLADVVVPCNIAPLNYYFADSVGAKSLSIVFASESDTIRADGYNGDALPSADDWHALLSHSAEVEVMVRAMIDSLWVQYQPFYIAVAEPIDPYLVYRKIEPGYETWNEMGIYERCLENFDESAVITNKRNDYGCINCHSFAGQDPNRMLLHMRAGKDGTYFRRGTHLRPTSAVPPKPYGTFVYPSWHPSGRYVAFSNNTTRQMFHTTDLNRIEVMDFASNIVVLDVETNQVLTSPLLASPRKFETFPAFSADGSRLFFCSADSVPQPLGYADVHYSLCSIAFDAETGAFGSEVEVLYDARLRGGSVSFPKVSPDGKWLMFTLSDYGNFSIWHREADLYMLNLETHECSALTEANSPDVESYHSWSSNSRWVVFSSRRIDGLYTRPFITYIDEEGRAHRPFLMPQDDVVYYRRLMKSYNVPELVRGPVGTLEM